MRTFFLSDLHFDGYKLLQIRDQYKSLDEMNRYMIEQWNSVVKDDDEIYIIGDLVDKECNNPEKFVSQLTGKKHLILGNHDMLIKNENNLHKLFESISDFKYITVDGYNITLCHYPLVEWRDSKREKMSIHIHGHIHTRMDRLAYKIIKENKIQAYNACVDINGLPVTIDKLIENNRKWYGW